MLHAAGIAVGVVWETTANRAAAGPGAGRYDAGLAKGQARTVGLPDTVAINFAVDFDTLGKPQQVDGYFDGAGSTLTLGRTGGYGSFEVIRHLFDTHRITIGWQTYAWSGTPTKWDPRAQLHQYKNGVNIGKSSGDLDEREAADAGLWLP